MSIWQFCDNSQMPLSANEVREQWSLNLNKNHPFMGPNVRPSKVTLLGFCQAQEII